MPDYRITPHTSDGETAACPLSGQGNLEADLSDFFLCHVPSPSLQNFTPLDSALAA